MIVIIDHYDSFTYNIYQAVAAHGYETRVIRSDAFSVEDIEALQPQAVVLSPGPGHPREYPQSLELIRAIHHATPILGICLGHQLLAAAFGGRVVQAPQIMHGKVSVIRHDGSGVFRGLPDPLSIMRYHSLAAERASLPEVFHIQAFSDDGAVMAFRHRDYPLAGIQFHPESIGTPEGDRLVLNFLEHRE
ncbi:anthranilate synthase component II [Indiicoccus explosivorum]|uniref:anthranilate synthase component II n=1 Tax=Indiicoccus explosivorum TaxID=1917864 RepID=UPI000B454BBC|nr:aminodeoxychorismate/anthranilate synthase component II [Indiicoccus explosivorum]